MSPRGWNPRSRSALVVAGQSGRICVNVFWGLVMNNIPLVTFFSLSAMVSAEISRRGFRKRTYDGKTQGDFFAIVTVLFVVVAIFAAISK